MGKSNYIFELNKYDPTLDYVKGVCILFVVLTHNLPDQNGILFSFWGSQAVPCFLLIQSFHAYKKGICMDSKIDLKKMFKRILSPYFKLSIITFFLLACYSRFSDYTVLQIVKMGIAGGGYGLGSYYIWIYLQFFLLLPLCRHLFIRFSGWKLLAIFIGLSSAMELLCSYIHPSAAIYRLLFFRYFFLIYLGYMLTVKKLCFTVGICCLNIISLLFIYLFRYSNFLFEPFFFDSDWKIFHWITYFYTASAFLYFLKKSFDWIPLYVLKVIQQMGKYSLEIFMCQMFVFLSFRINYLSFLENKYIESIVYIIITTIMSIFPVLFYFKKIKKNNYNVS